MSGDRQAAVVGRRPVMEALKANRRRIHAVLLRRGMEPSAARPILELAKRRRVPTRFVETEELDRLAGGANHQGAAALAEKLRLDDFSALLETVERSDSALVAVLDHLQDPRNLGAVLRSADGAGVCGAVLPTRRAAGVTPTVVKASAGATESVPVAFAVNIADAIRRLQKAGAWVVGAAGPNDSRAEPYDEFEYPPKTAFVIGHEGDGLARLTAERCDTLVYIPMLGQVESLNASVAAGVLFYEYVRQRKRSGQS
ncbi:MAG: 23S rRNA (guanosine(2251)-2'-O)-methyltransferase RlmB [Candidatus Poribacteria bacterium]|nr:23S rRNA (guanosine(2251)-2'-O)-methyltransferase RlmB [Candidatus Poribacteria bacterium]